MLVKQELVRQKDARGTVVLKNTFDCSTAAALAREATLSGGGRFGKGSGECVMLGHIPPEMWRCDPWLIAAERARREGDMGQYTKQVRKFFEMYPAFAITTPARYWHGAGGLV